MRIAKERINSLKSASTTKGRGSIPVTAKNAAQMRGRTGMKKASGNTASRSTGRKSSSRSAAR